MRINAEKFERWLRNELEIVREAIEKGAEHRNYEYCADLQREESVYEALLMCLKDPEACGVDFVEK